MQTGDLPRGCMLHGTRGSVARLRAMQAPISGAIGGFLGSPQGVAFSLPPRSRRSDLNVQMDKGLWTDRSQSMPAELRSVGWGVLNRRKAKVQHLPQTRRRPCQGHARPRSRMSAGAPPPRTRPLQSLPRPGRPPRARRALPWPRHPWRPSGPPRLHRRYRRPVKGPPRPPAWRAVPVCR